MVEGKPDEASPKQVGPERLSARQHDNACKCRAGKTDFAEKLVISTEHMLGSHSVFVM
jgi:hypothetical protein